MAANCETIVEDGGDTVVVVASKGEENNGSEQPSKRARKPSTRAQQNQEMEEVTAPQAVGPRKASGRARVAEPVAKGAQTGTQTGTDRREIEGENVKVALQAMLEQMNGQTGIMKTLLEAWKSQEMQNMKIQAEMQAVRGELEFVKQQNKEMQERLDAITASLSEQSSPRPSYADVARTHPGSQPSNLQTLSSFNTNPSTFTDTLFCTIDTSRATDGESDKPTAGRVRTAVEKEIRMMKDHANWRCRAVTMDPKNPNRVRIACRDEVEQQLVKQVAETKIATGVRVLRDELYPIKVDNVKRTAVLDENGEVRAGAAETFGKENETAVAKVAWLSRRDVPKAYGSMVVYLTKGTDARRLLAEGFFHVCGESGSTCVFERLPRPEQCYNCQEVGHKAFQCKKAQACGRCAKEGHHHNSCREAVMKCVLCGGPHESFSRSCPRLYPARHE